MDRGQTFVEAAHRETLEEAGLEVELTGLLAVEHTLGWGPAPNARMRVVFFARPRDPRAPPKSVPDAESQGAAWRTVAELEALAAQPPPKGLRGRELLEWGRYLDAGGEVFPIAAWHQEELRGPAAARVPPRAQ